jgi:hypothetical protein
VDYEGIAGILPPFPSAGRPVLSPMPQHSPHSEPFVASPTAHPFRVGRADARFDPTDEELDRFIETRLRLAGVDLSVLPEDDPDAPADRVRLFRSARNFLRNTAASLSAYELDSQLFPPMPYPASIHRDPGE